MVESVGDLVGGMVHRRKLGALRKHISPENMQIALLAVPFLVVLGVEVGRGRFEWSGFFEVAIVVSFLFVFVAQALARAISNWVGRYTEDSVKLTPDYGKLTLKYARERLLETYELDKTGEPAGRRAVFPFVRVADRTVDDPPFRVRVEDSPMKQYQLPTQVKQRSAELMSAHDFSAVHNNTNIRVDAVTVSGADVVLSTSRTTYFDSLLTNRVMDYPWADNRSVREVYEPGPFLKALPDSKLSNHLGFNGFVELADGNIVLVWRRGNLSIGKNMLGASVAASMKAKHALEDDQTLSAEGISRAIWAETMDELGVDLGELKDHVASIYAFYREGVEGGKPQFLFYAKTGHMDKAQFLENFAKTKRQATRRARSKDVETDGDTFEFIHVDDLARCTVTPGSIQLPDGRSYPMMPTFTGAFVLALRYLGMDTDFVVPDDTAKGTDIIEESTL